MSIEIKVTGRVPGNAASYEETHVFGGRLGSAVHVSDTVNARQVVSARRNKRAEMARITN